MPPDPNPTPFETATMTLTAEERADVSRRNGSRSCGPSSDEGKRISRRNALTHGVYARTLALDDENEQELGDLRGRYHASMDPRCPAEEHLVDDCFHFDVSTRRYRRSQKALLDRQADQALEHRRGQRQARLDMLRGDLTVNCVRANSGLRQMSEGCSWLAGRYLALRDALEGRGHLVPEELVEFLRLSGLSPASREPLDAEHLYRYELCNLGCAFGPSDPRVVARLRPENRPEGLRQAPFEAVGYESQAHCRADLRHALQMQIDGLAELGDELQIEEGRELGALLDECAVVNDPGEAKKYHRLATECTSGFHRAYNALRALARERKKEEGCEGSSGDAGRRGRAESSGDAGATGSAGAIAAVGESAPAKEVPAPARNEPGAAADPGTRNEPGAVAEVAAAGPVAETGAGAVAGAPRARNEPSRDVEVRGPASPGAGTAEDQPGGWPGDGGGDEEGRLPIGSFWQAIGLSRDAPGVAPAGPVP
jgi:hypothetical protein